MRGRGGFTLWEMAIVLALLAVTLGVAVPAYVGLGRDEADRPADVLLALLRDARREAIRSGTAVSLVLDTETGHWRADTLGPWGAGLLREDTLPVGRGFRFETDSARLRYLFRPTGAAIADTVRVITDRGAALVVVDAWSGVARADAR